MPFFPPQGTSNLQALRFRLRPNFRPIQGIDDGGGLPPGTSLWIDDLSNDMIDDLGNKLVFSP